MWKKPTAKDGLLFFTFIFTLLTSFAQATTLTRQGQSGDKRYRVIVGEKPGTQKVLGGVTIKGESQKSSVATQVRYMTEEEIQSWKKKNDVAFIEKDRIFKAVRSPGDSPGEQEDQFFYKQWPLTDSASGFRATEAWDLETGSSETVVAVLDTGITQHNDLNDKVLSGVDMISDTDFSNDGNGRDTDASDPGDWVQNGDSCYSGSFRSSSWHGTHVAGIAAAESANGIGVTGVSWNSQILPVRVLGKCGGLLSDIADGILWAAGVSVDGLPTNPNPADVINLSLGGLGSCGPTLQNAIDRANDRGAVVVVAAGNESYNMDFQDYSPANCHGVVTVGASDQNGDFAHYSNYGESVDVTAPGGTSFHGIISTFNNGQTSPGQEAYDSFNGTSMAAPHVSGLVALIKAHAPGLYPAQIREILRDSAVSVSNCPVSDGCGEGLVDAYQALVLAGDTNPDPDFVGDEPLRQSPGDDSSNFHATDDESGAGCGTIVDDQGGGPGSGNPAQVFTLLMLLALGLQVGFTQAAKRHGKELLGH